MKRLNAILNWSVRVGSLFGVPIYLHITLIFFLWPVLTNHAIPIAYLLEYIAGVVLCILLHELGHALTAKRYRMSGLSITLHGFGGFASSSGYRSPTRVLVIPFAGAAVHFALAGILIGIGHWEDQRYEFGSAASIQVFLAG